MVKKVNGKAIDIAVTVYAARARTIDRRFKRSGEWPIFFYYFLNHSKTIEIFSAQLRNSFYQTTVSGYYSTIDYAIIYLGFLFFFVTVLG